MLEFGIVLANMRFLRHFRNAFLDLAEVVGSLEGNDTSEIESSDLDQNQFDQHLEDHKGNDTSQIESSYVDQHQFEQHLEEHYQSLQQENIRHLRWQDRASMTIKAMEEGVQVRKSAVRLGKKRAFREKAAMRQQIHDLQLRIEASELGKTQMSNEHTLAIEEHKTDLLEARKELKENRETAEQAAAAAESRLQEAQAEHGMALSTAESRIEDLRAAQTLTFTCGREANDLRKQLATVGKENAEAIAAKDHEIRVLQTFVDGHDSEIRRFRGEAVDARRDKTQVIAEKNRLSDAKAVTDRRLESLQAEIERLTSEKREAEFRASGAEGRTKGLQDQLVVTEKRAENWETLYNQAEEKARDNVLSAYAFPTPQASEQDQRDTSTASKEMEALLLAEKLRKEKIELEKLELEKKVAGLTARVEEWAQCWEQALEGRKTWEQELRRQCEEENREALVEARAKQHTTRDLDAREQDVRRQCKVEKETALAAERENCRIQRESQLCSLRVQCAAKLKSDAIRAQEKIRRRAGTMPKKDLRIKKRQRKWVVRREVSNAIEVERSLIQKRLQNQFQTQLSAYKTQYESEHSNSENQEIKKLNDSLELRKTELKQACNEKRDAEKSLKFVREENERLSRQVMAHQSQQSTASQTASEKQVTTMAEEHGRALKLLDECAVMGLDEKHRRLLSELVEANKLVKEVRSKSKERQNDPDDLERKANQLMNSSDIFDSLDPSERPALHAQLVKAYDQIGGFLKIIKKMRAGTTGRNTLKSISRGKGKQKERQGAVFGRASSSSSASAAPSRQVSNFQTAFSNTPTLASTQVPNVYPTTNPPQPPAADSQDGPGEMDSATAHALQGTDEMNEGTSEPFDLDTIDWSNPMWLNLDPAAEFDFN